MANVPNAPGVPALLEAISTEAAIILLTQDLVSAFGNVIPTWGIFFGGLPIVFADNVVAFEYRQEWVIADYQVEQGGFVSYDKVATPFEGRMTLSAGGDIINRQSFLNSIAAIAGDTNLYEIRTPEQTYENVNIMRYNFRRISTKGAGLIEVEIFVREIRDEGSSEFTSTVQPSGADTVNLGTLQTSTPLPLQTAAAGNFT